jgi:putative pyoverdin transport system ATP-binding/permease protein
VVEREPNNDSGSTRVGSTATLVESLRILQSFWPIALFSTLAGGISGLATASLLATVNQAVHTQGEAWLGILTAFIGLSAVSLAGDFLGNVGNNLVGQRIIAKLRKELSAKILAAPLIEIERLQSHRLLAVLTHDVDTIGVFTLNFSMVVIAFSITVGCFIYLALLSPIVFVIVVLATALTFVGQIAASRIGVTSYYDVRNAHDELQKSYRAIIEGAKEVRINELRRGRVLDQLSRTIEQIAKKFMHAARIFFAARAFNSLFFYVTLFIVLWLASSARVQETATSGFILVLLYVKGPIEQIVAALPLFGQARASFRKVAELSSAIGPGEISSPRSESTTTEFAGKTIELRDVGYQFATQQGAAGPFVLGPVNLTIKAGEMLFIVGKNGCGKTTLIKLLVGLYTPQQGQLYCDGKPVQASQLEAYRRLFSVVFFDYYLFDDLIAANASAIHNLNYYLSKLEISQKVAIRSGAFSTIDLSTGQRKRLALIQVFLEDRPIIVLDEWAADQDPTFRRTFYEEILPELKQTGKTLIIISHDDQYFHVADRVIEMDDGRILEQRLSVDAPINSADGNEERQASTST